MKKEFIDTFSTPSTSWEITEAGKNGIVDGENILARVVGPSFLVNGTSGNKRFYSEKLWNNVLAKTNERMNKGQMLGTIGHEQPLDDQALLEGKASHRVSKLWINKKSNIGMAEYLVLNTPSGQVLNAYLRGGVEFPVSSRGFGDYNGKTEDGADIVDEETFQLETFDFVRTPGVGQAIPKLVENLSKETLTQEDREKIIESIHTEISKYRITEEVDDMDPQLLQTITEEKVRLQDQLAAALDSNKSIQAQLESATMKLEALGKDKGSILESKTEIEENFTKIQEQLKAYSDIGTVEEIGEALDAAKSLGEELKDLGSVSEIQTKLKTIVEYEELGSVEDLNKVFDLVEKYTELGTPEDLDSVLDSVGSLTDKMREEMNSNSADEFSKTHSVNKSVAEKLLSKFDQEEALEVVESLKDIEGVSSRYRLRENKEGNTSTESKSNLQSSRTERLFENMGGVKTTEE